MCEDDFSIGFSVLLMLLISHDKATGPASPEVRFQPLLLMESIATWPQRNQL